MEVPFDTVDTSLLGLGKVMIEQAHIRDNYNDSATC